MIQLTWIGETKPVSIVEKLNIFVSSGSICLGEGPGDRQDGAEAPHHDDGDQDGEQLEDLDTRKYENMHHAFD